MTELTLLQAINQALHLAMKKHKEVIIIGEDVGKDGGVFRTTEGLITKFGKDRVIDSPLSEAGIVGSCVGMAAAGLRPVAEIQFSGFIFPAMQEIVSHAARIRTRSRGVYTCPIVIRSPCSGGIRALEHHSESEEAFYAQVPGLKVIMPSTPYDAKGLLLAAIEDPDPVIFLEPKRIYRSVKEDVPDRYYTVPIGKAKVVQEGQDVTVVSWGAMMQTTRKALEQLKDISVELIDLRTMSPLDDATIVESVRKTGKLVVVQEAPKTCSVTAEIITRVNEKALDSLEAPMRRVSGPDVIMPLYQLENYYIPSVERIVKAIQETHAY